jgi:hypothetical protein
MDQMKIMSFDIGLKGTGDEFLENFARAPIMGEPFKVFQRHLVHYSNW